MEQDIAYCHGNGCILKDKCRRYKDGQQKDTGRYVFINYCDPETREMYIGEKN